jgi:hypothetical protein
MLLSERVQYAFWNLNNAENIQNYKAHLSENDSFWLQTASPRKASFKLWDVPDSSSSRCNIH